MKYRVGILCLCSQNSFGTSQMSTCYQLVILFPGALFCGSVGNLLLNLFWRGNISSNSNTLYSEEPYLFHICLSVSYTVKSQHLVQHQTLGLLPSAVVAGWNQSFKMQIRSWSIALIGDPNNPRLCCSKHIVWKRFQTLPKSAFIFLIYPIIVDSLTVFIFYNRKTLPSCHVLITQA